MRMYDDVICAISTANTRSAISIVRLSGKGSIDIVNKIFRGKDLTKVASHTIHYGYIYDSDQMLDEVLVSVFKAPRTYTKEDVVEINCHGGVFVTNKVLELCIVKGARLAEPGEFTKRAFLNGRIDLTQAEAVMDVIDAKNKETLKMSNYGLRGDIKRIIQEFRSKILEMILKIEVNIDYPEYEDEEQITKEYLIPSIKAIREMIIADCTKEREKALAKILPMQKQDFEEIFEAMGDYTVTIRLLDPPLHEFLPKEEKDIVALAKDLGVSLERMKLRISELEEANPMLGHRGCRLAISYPELPIMQTKAIIGAYCAVKKRNPEYKAIPEIMIPLVGEIRELRYLKDIIKATADQVLKENKIKGEYKIGTMIEVPRAALLSDLIGAEADFFSFGTNDLTQMTFGFSRDDGADFLKNYYEKKIYLSDPFARLDQEGVGQLVKLTVEKGRKANKKLKIGIC
jgi:hypothetical protein